MDIFKKLLTKKQKRNKIISIILDSFQKTKNSNYIIDNGDFKESYLYFTSFDVKKEDSKIKFEVLFYNNVGRNKKYLVTDFIRSQLCEGIDLSVIATYVQNRFDFKLLYNNNYENLISIYLKTIF